MYQQADEKTDGKELWNDNPDNMINDLIFASSKVE